MTDTDDSPSAIDVIRFVYLARLAEQRGDNESARRWQAKAEEWLQQQAANHKPGTADQGASKGLRSRQRRGTFRQDCG